MSQNWLWFAIGCGSLLWGCSFKLVIPSERTALEKQMLGEYKPIEDDVVLYTVVRSGNAGETGDQLDPYELARLNQKFNEDELVEFKDKQIIGETSDGMVAVLPGDVGTINTATALEKRLARILVAEENRDRNTIFKGLIAKNPDLTQADLASVKQSYAKSRQDEAKQNHWIQGEDGKWTLKSTVSAQKESQSDD